MVTAGKRDLPDHRDYVHTAPLPKSHESVVGVGYDDAKSWFAVRNSWGAQWGLKGYFTLPYAYLSDTNLASDFWTIRIVQ